MEPTDDLKALLDEIRRAQRHPTDNALLHLLPRLRAMAQRHLPPNSPLRAGIDSEDLMQEGLLQLVRSIDDFRGSTWPQFLAFVQAILAQKTAQQARRQAVRRGELHGAVDSGLLAGDTATPSVDAMAHEDRARLRRAIDALPEIHRTALELRLSGLDNEQMAARLGISAEALRQRLSRAVRALQERW